MKGVSVGQPRYPLMSPRLRIKLIWTNFFIGMNGVIDVPKWLTKYYVRGIIYKPDLKNPRGLKIKDMGGRRDLLVRDFRTLCRTRKRTK